MTKYRAVLLGGVCLDLCRCRSWRRTGPAVACRKNGVLPARAGGIVVKRGEFRGATSAEEEDAEAAADERESDGPAAGRGNRDARRPFKDSATASQPGMTSFYGDTAPPARPRSGRSSNEPRLRRHVRRRTRCCGNGGQPAASTEAAPAPEAAPTPAAETTPTPATEAAPAVADETLPMTTPGTTAYYGETAPASPPAWAAEAAMNPDYDATPAAPAAAPEAAPAAAVEEPLP